MIKVSVMYPSGEGATFDHDYYVNKHIPMAVELLGPKLKSATVDRGLGGREAGAPPPYLAIANLVFDSIEDFQGSMGPAGPKLAADGPNYTNTTAILQVSEIAL
jgi:uncharacterized protein (TIGR02118 family)